MAILDHDSTRISLQGFDGRVALVTGGARGIGRRVAETLLALGARVAAFDLDRPDVPGALGIEMDVTDPRRSLRARASLSPSSVPARSS